MEPLKETIQEDLKGFVNIRQFSLAAGVKENGPEVKAIKEYVKTKDISKIQAHLDSGKIIEMNEKHNIIVNLGLEELIKSITNERTTAPYINYCLLGTGTPNAVPGSTKLVNETFRRLAMSRSHDHNVAYIDVFIAAADCANTTYTEFGNVIDGTSTKDTGILFSYIATGGWVKTQSLFISCEYHLNNA